MNKSLCFGLVICALAALMSLVSLLWTPYEVARQDISSRFTGLGDARHWLGTDALGRDTFSQLLVGTSNSMSVALLALTMGASLGVMLGLVAAAKGGWLAELIARLSDLAFAFPSLLIAILLAARFGPSALNATIAIAIFNIPIFARITKSSAQVLWRLPYVQSAMTLGRSWVAISWHHVLPNLMVLLIVQFTIQLGIAVLAEAGLSYLGLGRQPPEPSLGKMLKEAQTLVYLAPRLVLIPGLTLFLIVLGLNLLGDGLRDWLDPRMKDREL